MDYFYSAFLLKESFFGMINNLALTIIVKGLTFGAKKKGLILEYLSTKLQKIND